MIDQRIELDGDTVFTRNGEYDMYHQATIVIEPGRVSTAVAGRGKGCETVKPVVSEHPAVERYHREIDEALQMTAYRNRPIHSIFKPERKRRKR